ncbi:MAG: hypothetical protein WBA93_16045, partial [Microcoleaceae cyanobacterium]
RKYRPITLARLTLPQKAVRPRRGSLALGMRTKRWEFSGGYSPAPKGDWWLKPPRRFSSSS